MRSVIFVTGFVVIALGLAATKVLERATGFGFLEGALVLGGALIICGIFSFRLPLHGFIGAGILSLLGAARGLGNVPSFLAWLSGERSTSSLPLLEAGVTALCCVLLFRVIGWLRRERQRQMLEEK